ncbi:MAG TPA: hypothetical protein HPP66_06135 [Planctomycetes bacterium]|nr:hypothetical protein [Planctomycetota bacterium]
MAKHKAGLHKNISSIFDGVPVSQDNDAGHVSSAAMEEPASYGPPSHLTGTTTKSQRPEASPPKAEQRQERKAAPKQKVTEKPKAIKPERPGALEQTIQRIKDKLFAPKPGVKPARQKAMVVLMPIMFIGMVLAFYKVLGVGPGKRTQAQTFKPSKVAAAAASTIDWQIPPPYPKTLRDPMQLGSVSRTTQGEIGKIDVKGIVYSEDDPSAIIGTEILHEGEKVSGATIVKINKDSVEFEMNGKRWTEKVR